MTYSELMSNTVKLYADDTKLLSRVNDLNCQISLQNDLDKAYEWSKTWLVEFNLIKCLVMHYGSNNPNFKYRINNHELAVTSSERDLGVIFSPDLKWKQQVTTCVSKANSMLGLIKKHL